MFSKTAAQKKDGILLPDKDAKETSLEKAINKTTEALKEIDLTFPSVATQKNKELKLDYQVKKSVLLLDPLQKEILSELKDIKTLKKLGRDLADLENIAKSFQTKLKELDKDISKTNIWETFTDRDGNSKSFPRNPHYPKETIAILSEYDAQIKKLFTLMETMKTLMIDTPTQTKPPAPGRKL